MFSDGITASCTTDPLLLAMFEQAYVPSRCGFVCLGSGVALGSSTEQLQPSMAHSKSALISTDDEDDDYCEDAVNKQRH